MNKILFDLVKTLSDDDLYEILNFITLDLNKRGYDVYDILCSINDNVKKRGSDIDV